jgi:hypothetical protein
VAHRNRASRLQRRKKEAVLCRWNAWRQAKEHYLRSELGEAVRVCAIDNDELSKTNRNGERILLNGEPWVPQLVEHILEAKVTPPLAAHPQSHADVAVCRMFFC